MKIMKMLDRLISKVDVDKKVEIYEMQIELNEYIILVSKKNFEAHMNSFGNKFEVVEISQESRREIDQKYNLCLKYIKRFNELSEDYLGMKIYQGDFSRENIEEFLLELFDEMFSNRSISRR